MRRIVPWLLPAVCAAVLAPPATGDFWLFWRAGRRLLSSDGLHVFADPSIQVGPLQLALFGSLGHWVGYVIAPMLALLVVSTAYAVGVRSAQVLALAGLASIVTGLTSSGIDSGHPADALLPLLWILAAVRARRGDTVGAAAIVGAGAGFETWSILGIAVLALAPRLRSAVVAVPVAAGVAASLYLPFVLAGQFRMGEYRWHVSSDALMSLFVQPGTGVGWPMRFAQGACALAAGIALARVARRSAHALWLVPAVVVLVRLLLDPLGSGYYYVGIEAPAMIGLALVSVAGVPLPRLAREPLA